MSKAPNGLRSYSPDFGRGMSLAFEFAGAVFLFWLIGRLVDNRFGIEPWGQVVGSIIGWVGGFLHVYYRTKGAGWQAVPGTRRAAPSVPGEAAPRAAQSHSVKAAPAGEAASSARAARSVEATGSDETKPAPHQGNGRGGTR